MSNQRQISISYIPYLKQERMDQPKQQCDNCLQEFPESKIATHFAYCRRNIKRCPTCRQFYDINFQEEHQEQYHKQENCPYCQLSFSSTDIQTHTNHCNKKPKYCEYCDLNVPVETYPAHLKDCQSRTKPCTKCNKPITNKEYLIHLVSCTGPVEEYKPKNYQEYIQDQRRVLQHDFPRKKDQKSHQVVRKREEEKKEEGRRSYEVNRGSKDKGVVAPQRDIRQPRREEKQYAPISHTTAATRATGNSRLPPSYNQYPREEVKPQRRDNNGYREIKAGQIKDYRQRDFKEVKRQEPRVYNKPINPPPPTFSYKREEQKPRGVVPTTTSTRSAVREVKPVSNKDLFPQNKPTIKSSKSNERPKPEQRARQVPSTRIPAPESKQRVIYQSEPHEVPPSEDFLNEMAMLDLSPEQREMQMAIMQSMGGGKSGFSFESQMNNAEMVAQQKAIEEQMKRNRRKW